jgi:hypothetical protein
MKSKRLAAFVLGAVAVAFYAGNALATDPVKFSGTTLAKATFGEIDSHVVAEPGWQEKIKTKGNSDLYVQQNTWDPTNCDGCTPSGAVAKTIAVQLIPAGAIRRQDVTPAPGNCPF